VKSFLSELFQSNLSSQIFLLLWAALAWILGGKHGFFHWDKPLDRKKIPLSPLGFFFFFALFMFCSFFLSPLFSYFLKPLFFTDPTNDLLFISLSSALQVFTTFILLFWFSYAKQKETLFYFFHPPLQPLPSFWRNLLVSIASWWIIYPSISFIHEFLTSTTLFFFHLPRLPDQTAIEFLRNSMSSPSSFFLALLMILVFAPMTEELFFRGYLQNFFKKTLGRGSGMALSSFVFAFFHFSFRQGANNIPIIASLFLLGLSLGFLYERQNSLTAPILLHSFFNLSSVLNFVYLQGA
jgi:uncharacterized protein